jgi:hypothetical protein
MASSPFVSLALVVAGGVAQGVFLSPTKWIRNWKWENYWLIFSLTSYLIVPWLLLAFLTIPKLFDIYAGSRVDTNSMRHKFLREQPVV